ncbi:MAG: RNA pseudouridine synthase [Candidatus Omnitrophica bacterium]|nr:RNA pseudouridine synthase [Candidatus Omnitrophota bacterium]
MHKLARYSKIYEDIQLVIVDKIAGQLTVPASEKDEISLLDLLNSEYLGKGIKILPCHRLDKETSGLVIFAKDEKTQEEIAGLFRKRKILKTYIAIVHGWIKKDSGELRSYLRDKAIHNTKGKLAISKFKVLKKNAEYSLLEVSPLTGRKNQIRIQFKEIGHPIVGERKFVFARDFDLKSGRLCLHAWKLSFFHPETGQHLNLESLIPEPIKKFF